MTGDTPRTTSLSLSSRQIWIHARGILLALTLLIVAGITLAALRSGDAHGRLDPRSAERIGSRAVAELLSVQGVSLRVVTTNAEAAASVGPDTTLLVTDPDRLTPAQQRRLHTAAAPSGGRLIVISAGARSVETLAPGVRAASTAPVSARAPRCGLPAAVNAGSADLGGDRYVSTAPAADVCYPHDGLPTLLRVPTADGGDTVLLGAPDILYNHRLDKHGNASLALRLLGSRTHLVWYLPSPDDAADDTDGTKAALTELIPSGWLWGSLQLTIAALCTAIWRARRLGPLVTERLPVAIPASESTEGRARLYHQLNARGRVADALRAATRTRLASLLGVPLPEAHSPAVLIPAVTAHLTTGDHDLTALLFGAAPADDNALVRLANHLDTLEREVRTT
ncbi:DUF4350 domain-containing protein [Streptomyces sp. NPDC057638]|uniref:DUF4350 domain-containing protein n=1 Tax=Streptomyces sp. NPDC057638 TaxID=3346190 RepID=UPI0036C6CCFE